MEVRIQSHFARATDSHRPCPAARVLGIRPYTDNLLVGRPGLRHTSGDEFRDAQAVYSHALAHHHRGFHWISLRYLRTLDDAAGGARSDRRVVENPTEQSAGDRLG